MRSAALAAAPAVALLFLVAACGSDDGTSASSTPSTPSTSIAAPTTASTTTVLPGSTAIGQPIPIGQETTVAPTVPGATASATTGAPVPVPVRTTTPGAPGTTATGPGTPTTAASGGGATSTTTTDPDVVPPGPNADTAFCTFNAEVEEANDAAVDDAAFLAALRGLYARMDQWIADAPSTDLRTSATTLRDATKQAIDSGELDPFNSDDAVEALLRVTLYCG